MDLNDILNAGPGQIPLQQSGYPVSLPGGPSALGGQVPSALSGLLSQVSSLMGPAGMITGGLQLGGQIANLFRTTPDNQDKKTATNQQENIQKVAMDIQNAVNTGQMRPEAALIALDSLEKQAQTMGSQTGMAGGSSRFAAGGQTAQLIIEQVKAGVQSKFQNNHDAFVNAPWRDMTQPNSNPNAGSPESGQVMNLNDAGANEGLQNARVRTGLRNYLLGADNSLAGTPLTSGLTPKNPLDSLTKVLPGMQQAPQTARPGQVDPYAAGMRY